MGSFAANATIFPMMNFVPSTPAFSNIFSFPDASISIPAHAIRVKVNAEIDIAVEATTCFFNDSSNEGDLDQSGLR